MITVTATDDIWTDNPVLVAQFAGKEIEVPRISGQPVNANQRLLGTELLDITPFEIVDAVESVKPQAKVIMF
jgi:hypothetical protein